MATYTMIPAPEKPAPQKRLRKAVPRGAAWVARLLGRMLAEATAWAMKWIAGVVWDAAVAFPRAAICAYAALWAWAGVPLWVGGADWWNVAVVAVNPAVWAAAWAAWDYYYLPACDDEPDDFGDVEAIWEEQIARQRTVAV